MHQEEDLNQLLILQTMTNNPNKKLCQKHLSSKFQLHLKINNKTRWQRLN